jgi:hypothetical protein
MLATTILKRHPHALLRRVEATTSKLLSAIRRQQYCDPITASCRRTFSNTGTTTGSGLVSTKLDVDMGIAEITMQNGSVNALSLEM